MSTKRKGVLTTSGEWAKHLRKWGRRAFWKAERKAGKREAVADRRGAKLDRYEP